MNKHFALLATVSVLFMGTASADVHYDDHHPITAKKNSQRKIQEQDVKEFFENGSLIGQNQSVSENTEENSNEVDEAGGNNPGPRRNDRRGG